jgi:hypothetical protein
MNTEFKQTRLSLEQYLLIFVGSGFGNWKPQPVQSLSKYFAPNKSGEGV